MGTPARREYSAEEIEKALIAYALESGREKPVLALLEEANLDIPIKTLRNWAYRSRREQYEQIKSMLDSAVRHRLGDTFSRLADLSSEIAEEALTQLKTHLESGEMDPKELAKVLHEAMVSAGISTEKAQLLAGNPTERVQVDFGDIKRTLEERHGIRLNFIEGSATEEPVRQELEPAA